MALLTFAGVCFGLYRIWVQVKDANIQVLRDQLAARDKRIQDLETQTPDALVKNLSARVTESLKEIERLNEDKQKHATEIHARQTELAEVQDRLRRLTALISDSDLLCPTCGAPLVTRLFHTVYGPNDQDAEVQYVEYECGYTEDEIKGVIQPCPHSG